LRREPEDFEVEEILGFEPDGEGQHALLWVEKRGLNSDAVAAVLARVAGVDARQVSYSGRKDRHAVTRQWFSVDLAGRAEPDWAEGMPEGVVPLRAERHRRKLRRGSHQGNRFRLRLRDVDGDWAALEQRLERVAVEGVPNYFGPQRFGRDGGNLEQARAWFAGGRRRGPKDLLLSAARSHLFNRVLAARVVEGNWQRACPGEPLILDGSASYFTPEAVDASIEGRLSRGDVHPSGPLWGRGEGPMAPGEVDRLADEADLRTGLERAGLRLERRSLRLFPARFEWHREGSDLLLAFELPRGTFATAVVRELADVGEAQA
jgi:tRNA pseudouridine13 synthase